MSIRAAWLWLIAGCCLAPAWSGTAREVVPLDDNWRFFKGDVAGAEQPNFNDLRWTSVHVPHDWKLAGPLVEWDKVGAGGSSSPGSVAWYRANFALPSSALEQRVTIEFDGVEGACDVWLNGMHLGHQANGSAGFRYQVPATMLAFGSGPNNLLTVCSDLSVPPAEAWYVGAGLCRPVRVVINDPVHILTQNVTADGLPATNVGTVVSVTTVVTNESPLPHDMSLQVSVFSPEREAVGAMESSQTIPPEAAVAIEQQVVCPPLPRWTLENPALCRMEARLRVYGRLADQAESNFAVRTVDSESEGGIMLNRRTLAIRAVRVYPDGGAFGAAVPRAIWESRLRTLKTLGVNAVWSADGAWGPAMDGLCDRLGLLDLGRFPETVAQMKDSLDIGIDYLVESQSRTRVGHDGGLLDRAGAVNPLGSQRQTEWQRGRVVSVFRRLSPGVAGLPAKAPDGLATDWTPGSLKPHTEKVVVYSNCKDLDLLLNGKSLGEKEGDTNGAVREWSVPFVAGVIAAVGRDGGRTVATNELRTAGKPVRLVLTTDRLSLTPVWDDVVPVRAEVLDAKGITVPSADELITFKVSGPGLVAAVDNADTASLEPFAATACHAYRGRCTAYLRASQARGRITVTATAAGLKSGSVGIWAAPVQAR